MWETDICDRPAPTLVWETDSRGRLAPNSGAFGALKNFFISHLCMVKMMSASP